MTFYFPTRNEIQAVLQMFEKHYSVKFILKGQIQRQSFRSSYLVTKKESGGVASVMCENGKQQVDYLCFSCG